MDTLVLTWYKLDSDTNGIGCQGRFGLDHEQTARCSKT